MNKQIFLTLLFGFGGGLFAFLFMFFIFSKPEANLLLNISDSSSKIQITSSPTPSGNLDLWEKILADHSLNLVGIHVFFNDKVVRQGSGVVLSSDGLIITTADLLVAGGVYQIFFGDEVFKGTVMTRDFNLNLMIIKTVADYPSVVNIDSNYDYNSGRDVILVGKLVNLSRPVLFMQKGTISYRINSLIQLDTTPNYYISGSGVIDGNGRFAGISYLRNGGVRLVSTHEINNFFNKFLETNK